MSTTPAAKRLTCVVPGCNWTESAPTEPELMEKVAAHAAADHGVTEVTPELAAKIKSAIRSEPAT